MDVTTIVGLVLGFGGVLLGYYEEGGHISKLAMLAPFLIVFVGGFGAMLVTFPLSEFKKLFASMHMIFIQKKYNEIDIIHELAELSERARRDGLLSLEQDSQTHKNELIRKGLALVVDGIETEVVRDILDREIKLQDEIYESGAKIFEAMGATWPAMGVCGTVMGMISILRDLTDPLALGPKISGAFIATMYGVGFANLLFLPCAGKIKAKAAREAMISEIIVEGLLSIQAGENPRLIKEKLNLHLMEKLNSSNKNIGRKKNSPVTIEEGAEA